MVKSVRIPVVRGRGWYWVMGVCGVIGVVVVGYVGVQILKGLDAMVEPQPVHISDAQLLDRIEQLRARGDIRQYAAALKQELVGIAHDIGAIAPGLTWEWHRESSVGSCSRLDASWRDVPTVQWRSAFLVLLSPPDPDQYWAKAVEIVRVHAAKYGAIRQERLSANMKRIVFSNPDNGTFFDFDAEVDAVLTANSGCFLAEDVYHNKVTPQQILQERRDHTFLDWKHHDIP